MRKTRVCELLGIEYPIIQGGMSLIANAELAASVSEAGGLGIISPNAGEPDWGKVAENLRNQIRKAKSLTDKPFGVNFSIQNIGEDRSLIDIAIEEGVRVVTIGAGSPALHTKYLKEHKVKVLHVVASVRHARGAEKNGVDAVIAEGYESGGLNSPDEITTFVLIPQVVDAVSIPVVAAGGICDAKGFVAALALGAEGVQMGTRFIATRECIANQSYKEAIVEATDTSTVITGRRLIPTRGLKNELTKRIQEKESAGASREELLAILSPGLTAAAALRGDIVHGQALAGAVAGMIKEIMSASDVVRSIVEGYDRIVAGL
ncbi:MAG: nitronate monooxygenase [Dehalococcoidia bacterium]|nr:nitronate monooxygenase [Dehalococcoidia bacterium]